jgi:hypothetical protein
LESAAAWGCTGNYTPYLFLRRSGPRHERGFGSSSAVNGERYGISSHDNERDFVSSDRREKSIGIASEKKIKVHESSQDHDGTLEIESEIDTASVFHCPVNPSMNGIFCLLEKLKAQFLQEHNLYIVLGINFRYVSGTQLAQTAQTMQRH